MVASVPELANRHSGRPNRAASSSATQIASSVGWAKWVPRATRRGDRLDDRGVAVAGDGRRRTRRASRRTRCRRRRRRGSPGRGSSTRPAARRSASWRWRRRRATWRASAIMAVLRGWRATNASDSVVDEGVEPRRAESTATEVVTGCLSVGIERRRARLTECSVYVTVSDGRQHLDHPSREASMAARAQDRRVSTGVRSLPRSARRCCATPLAGLSVPTLSALLQACADSPTGGGRRRHAEALEIASPDNPVTWPISDDNQPIADGLAPEAGPLLLYNYADYIAPAVVKAFEEKYGVEVKVSTFNDTDEALTKIRTGAVPFDIYFPSYDQIGRLVDGQAAAAAQPQLPHQPRQRLADASQTPGTTGEARYSVPYSVYTHRRSAGAPTWSPTTSPRSTTRTTRCGTPTYARQGRRSSTTGTPRWRWSLLRDGITDINSDDPDDLAHGPASSCTELREATKPKVTISMYTDLPVGPARHQPDVVGRRRSTRSTTCPRASRSTSCATGSPRTARAWSTTT